MNTLGRAVLVAEYMLAIVFKLHNATADVVKRPMPCRLGRSRQIRVPSVDELLDRSDIDAAVMEEVVQFGHVAPEETPVLANRIAAQRRYALDAVLAKEFDCQRLGLGHRNSMVPDSIQKSILGMVCEIPIVHLSQFRLGLRNRESRPLGNHSQIALSYYGGNLNNGILFRFETSHLEVHPD